jgi:hypothetical protein
MQAGRAWGEMGHNACGEKEDSNSRFMFRQKWCAAQNGGIESQIWGDSAAQEVAHTSSDITRVPRIVAACGYFRLLTCHEMRVATQNCGCGSQKVRGDDAHEQSSSSLNNDPRQDLNHGIHKPKHIMGSTWFQPHPYDSERTKPKCKASQQQCPKQLYLSYKAHPLFQQR